MQETKISWTFLSIFSHKPAKKSAEKAVSYVSFMQKTPWNIFLITRNLIEWVIVCQ